MSFENRGRMPLDYHPVALPGSVLRFRGPLAATEGPTIVCLGGSETFGRFIHAPFPTQLDRALPLPVLNLGVVNAGLDVMMNDPAIGAALDEAQAVVLQITSAHNVTNRFYTVHPRRNDRFVKASPMLRTIYPQVDFTEFHFTRHLLRHLIAVSSDRFEIVRGELQTAWVARMQRFIEGIGAPVHLLWLSNRAPGSEEGMDGAADTGPARAGAIAGTAATGGAAGAGAEGGDADVLSMDPLFVTARMLDEVARSAASLTIATPGMQDLADSVQGKFFAPREAAAARLLPGPELHDRVARALLPCLGYPLPEEGGGDGASRPVDGEDLARSA